MFKGIVAHRHPLMVKLPIKVGLDSPSGAIQIKLGKVFVASYGAELEQQQLHPLLHQQQLHQLLHRQQLHQPLHQNARNDLCKKIQFQELINSYIFS